MYKERMNSYYPEVIRSILEFQSIIDAEYPEFEDLSIAKERIINDAYLITMSEDRIKQWESLLRITPIPDSTLSDRRDTIIARIRGQGKLNSELINIIVGAFTGGTANSWIKDSTLYVEITPPPDNKQYKFANVEQELKLKVPAHLALNVDRNYYTWEEIKKNSSTWQNIKDNFDNWNDVCVFVPFN